MHKNYKTEKYPAKVSEKSNKKIAYTLKMRGGCGKVSDKITRVGQ